jgi:molybdenum cofactor biosynthesis enzyme MoaA
MIFTRNRGIFRVKPGFYVAQNIIEDYDLFEKFGRCDNRCFFCCMEGSPEPADLIQKGTYSGGRKLLFCSGEPLNIKDVCALVGSLKKKWKKVSVCTNAKRLSDRRFAREFMKCGVDEIFVTMNGHNALIHDSISRVRGSFAKTVQGLRNVLELGKKTRRVDILAVCMLTKNNLFFYMNTCARRAIWARGLSVLILSSRSAGV